MKRKMPCTNGFTLIEIMIVVAIIGMLAAIAVPNYLRAQAKVKTTACINNLKQIEGAKLLWAMENRTSPSTIPDIANIQPYLGRGTSGSAPTCPADGAGTFATSYNLNELQSLPTCRNAPLDHHLE